MVFDGGDRKRLEPGVGLPFHNAPRNATRMDESRYAHAAQATGARLRTVLADTESVSELRQVSPAKRRRMARHLTPPGAVLVLAGLTPILVSSPLAWKVVGLVVLAIAVLLIGVVIGLRRSAAQDEAAQDETELDAAITASALGYAPCGSDCAGGACGMDDCAVKALRR
ncbi:MAG: hypothetical protein JWN47_1539 [Frankiales bacterium]|jgi:hypothetical protein|nr:hypothetical protein [Frankiales bacterium]